MHQMGVVRTALWRQKQRSEVQGHLQLQIELENSLDYERLCSTKQKPRRIMHRKVDFKLKILINTYC